MLPILHELLAPALTLSVVVVGALVCRDKRRAAWRGLVAPLAALVGWAALAPWPRLPAAATEPHNGPELLLLPAAAALLPPLVGKRVVAVAAALFTAWWVARSPAGQPEFWRVLAAVCLATLWARRVASDTRAAASGLALWLGLAMAGGPAAWRMAALVLAIAAAGAAPPAMVLAGAIVAADLGSGRLVRGSIGLADAACLAALVAPLLVRPIAGQIGRRLGPPGPLVAALLAGALAAVTGWLLQRALIR